MNMVCATRATLLSWFFISCRGIDSTVVVWPNTLPDRMPEDMSDRVPEDMPDRMPEDLPDRMPEDMPDHMPEDMPDRMSNRMSEDMSDRMPEDLPVRKCINVMVGITRSKVIWVQTLKLSFDMIKTENFDWFAMILLIFRYFCSTVCWTLAIQNHFFPMKKCIHVSIYASRGGSWEEIIQRLQIDCDHT